jgi:aryl carrier-like protein
MILEILPLNANGKIDRKNLPAPNLSQFSSRHLTNNVELSVPINEIETTIHHIWCDIFQQNQISTDTNIFTIGGHSLLLMQLFHRYKTQFHIQANALSISDLFQYPTIAGHSELIHQTHDNTPNIDDCTWLPLNVIQGKTHNFFIILSIFFVILIIIGPASFAQERIFLDEQIRFASKNNNVMYLIAHLYRVTSNTNHVSISRLSHAMQAVLTRHNILRTALYIGTNSTIIQHCLDMTMTLNEIKLNEFSVINLRHDDDNIEKEINRIINDSNLFDLSKGRFIHCHILRYCRPDDALSSKNDDLLSKDDCILFCMHHSAFDGTSTSIFLHDLALAYETNCSVPVNDNTLQYIDYAVHERVMDTTSSRQFWHSQLVGYDLQRPLSLPVDRHRSSTDQRSGLASLAQISLNNDISRVFLNYASSYQLTPFQLGLSVFYAFLFKLTHGDSDLCIASINANRYRPELEKMIGMFVATLPYRIQLHSQWSFDQLVKHVREKCLSILEHSHYSLQHILADVQLNQSNVSFLETMFDFIIVSLDVDRFSLNDVILEQMSIEQSFELAKFDFSMTFMYNAKADGNQLSCSLMCSRDIVDKTTVALLSQRFEYFFNQIFGSSCGVSLMDDCMISMKKVYVILPEEAAEMGAMIFHRLENIVEEGMCLIID